MNRVNKAIGIGCTSIVGVYVAGCFLLNAALNYGTRHPIQTSVRQDPMTPEEKQDYSDYMRWLSDYKNPHVTIPVLERDLGEIKRRGARETKWMGVRDYEIKANAIEARLYRMKHGLPEPPSTSQSRANEDF